MEKQMTIDVISFLHFLIGGLLGALISYLNQKGKNRALIEDNRRLEREKQEVVHEFSTQLEILKKEFTLDVEKKKYQYQAKQEQYIKFFSSLDTFTRESNDKIREEVSVQFGKFLVSFSASDMEGDSKSSLQAVSDFFEFNQKLMSDINKGYQALKQETYAINLVCSKETKSYLLKLEMVIERANQSSFNYLSKLCTPEGFHHPDRLDHHLTATQEDAKAIEEAKEKVIESMRLELSEI